MEIWTGIVILPIVAVLWICGYLIATKKRVDLIAGFDRDKVTDVDAYAGWVGGAAYVCGLGLLATWGLIAVDAVSERHLLAGILISAALALVIAFAGTRRYTRG